MVTGSPLYLYFPLFNPSTSHVNGRKMKGPILCCFFWMNANQCYLALNFHTFLIVLYITSQVKCTVTNEKGSCIFIRIHIMFDELLIVLPLKKWIPYCMKTCMYTTVSEVKCTLLLKDVSIFIGIYNHVRWIPFFMVLCMTIGSFYDMQMYKFAWCLTSQ